MGMVMAQLSFFSQVFLKTSSIFIVKDNIPNLLFSLECIFPAVAGKNLCLLLFISSAFFIAYRTHKSTRKHWFLSVWGRVLVWLAGLGKTIFCCWDLSLSPCQSSVGVACKLSHTMLCNIALQDSLIYNKTSFSFMCPEFIWTVAEPKLCLSSIQSFHPP